MHLEGDDGLGDKCIKIRMDEDAIDLLKKTAKERGITMSDFVQESVAREIKLQLFLDRKFWEKHTQEIERLRQMMKRVYFTPFENKLLVAEEFKTLVRSLEQIEDDEAKLRKEVRNIRMALNGKGGTVLGDAQVQ